MPGYLHFLRFDRALTQRTFSLSIPAGRLPYLQGWLKPNISQFDLILKGFGPLRCVYVSSGNFRWNRERQRISHDAKLCRQPPGSLAVHLHPDRLGVDRLAAHLRCPDKADAANMPEPA